MNRLNFSDINFPGLGATLFGMVKRTRKMFDSRMAALEAGPKDGREFTQEEMLEKQISSYLTNIEFDFSFKVRFKYLYLVKAINF